MFLIHSEIISDFLKKKILSMSISRTAPPPLKISGVGQFSKCYFEHEEKMSQRGSLNLNVR